VAPAADSAPTTPHARALPPLDYDDTGHGKQPQSLESTRPGRRSRTRRLRWFVLGIAVGALGAFFATGDADGTLRAVRAWGGRTLRSLEHRSHPSSVAAAPSPGTVSATVVSRAPAKPKDAPCPVDPGPDDPCAELLAPFSPPTVSVNDLPRVKPAVLARRRHVPAGAAPAAEPDSPDDDPYADDPQSSPTRATPSQPGSPVEEKAPADVPPSREPTAQADPV
jgi:hypothetical protein